MTCPVRECPSDAVYRLPILRPMVLAGSDPQAERQLVPLDRCLTSGRYLSPNERVGSGRASPSAPSLPLVPVLASAHSFVDESFAVQIERSSISVAVLNGSSVDQLKGWALSNNQTLSMDDLYRQQLQSVDNSIDTWPVWTASDVNTG